jgi:diguanylate cyclase (GGDEF)-like protein
MLLVDPQTGEIRNYNPALLELLGYQADETPHLTWADLGISQPWQLPLQPDHLSREHTFQPQQGSEIWVAIDAFPITGAGKTWLGVTFQDITLSKHMQVQLHHAASHDRLTGALNRSSFISTLQQTLGRQQPKTAIGVLLLDLDAFKGINDSIGYWAGDELIATIVTRLQQNLPPDQVFARLGGDEFGVLLQSVADPQEAMRVAEQLLAALQAPVELRGQPHPVHISASIGIAVHPVPERSSGATPAAELDQRLDQLLRDAHLALDQAKARGQGQVALFDSQVHKQTLQRLQLETELRQAIEQEQLEVYFQPIILLETSQIAGFEALIRWQHPEKGMIPPAKFIPMAEATDLILQIDRWVMQAVCRQWVQWSQQFPDQPPLSMSVNLSGRHFSHPDLVPTISQLLADHALPPDCLKLEITESLITADDTTVRKALAQLRQLGLQLSIDDFGVGYSSLSRLSRFPINTLKIDRSFIKQIGPNGENSAPVRAIITLAHSLGMNVVAEGVETLQQLQRIALMRCNFAQGYFFSRPINSHRAEQMLKDQQEASKDGGSLFTQSGVTPPDLDPQVYTGDPQALYHERDR